MNLNGGLLWYLALTSLRRGWGLDELCGVDSEQLVHNLLDQFVTQGLDLVLQHARGHRDAFLKPKCHRQFMHFLNHTDMLTE